MKDRPRSLRSGRRGVVASALAAGVALLPNVTCPACWPAYAGLLSALGVPVLMNRAALLPLTLSALALALFMIGFRATRRHGYGPFALALAAATLVVVGKFALGLEMVAYVGIGLLVFASVWNSRPVQPSKSSCKACSTDQELIQISAQNKPQNNS